MKLKIKKLTEAAIVPTYGTVGSACFDLYAASDAEVGACGGTAVVPTGLAFEVPAGWALMIYSRSGHGFKNGVRLVNSVGVIDSDYRGEVLVGLRNESALRFNVRHGDRIAQAMLVQSPAVDFEASKELSGTARGVSGFGSTGF